ncbi:MAG: type II toxin-antitoxin system death-on-curing family toxin [Candidatus Dependentiae bacterium]|nr:type II toxin-antitoxin system death-on-curing family toxin [Candidatus Dependentiae bacterium]
MNAVKFLEHKAVLRLHCQVIDEFGGIHGLRDSKLLDSALAQPQITIFSEYAYKDIFEMATAYCYHLIKNHPFIDGNKRIGLLTALTFLELNGIIIDAPFDELYDMTMKIADSKITKEKITQFFKKHSKKL